jgi:acyl-CoA reductase-like NAD-dependent aldehyde dehydrogenase
MSSPTSPSATEQRPIRVTLHARKRARERHGDLRLLSERRLLGLICSEVGAALRAGRFAKNVPREAVEENYSVRKKGDRERFTWDEKRTRVYVIRRTEGVVLVITTLATVNSQP